MYLFIRAREFFTPIRMFSFLVILMALIDGFNIQFSSLEGVSWLINFFIRILMFNAGFFGIFGNGKTKRIRAFIVSLPFLYFSFYGIISLFYKSEIYHALVSTVFFVLGMWILLFGDYYE